MRKRLRSVRRSLLIRLGLAGVALAATFGGVAFLLGRAELEDSLRERTLLGVELLRAEVHQRMADGSVSLGTAIRGALEHLAAIMPQAKAGDYSAVVAYNQDRQPVARFFRSPLG
jgi:hypothetical protein